MATQDYWDWDAAGRHFQVARPIVDMAAVARRHDIAVLGIIGNEDHLTADFPEDHTPFSRTYWPVPAKGWICACDLANVRGLGDAILRDARARRLPWLKYMNFGGRSYSHEDSFQYGAPNGDEHVHLSCRSDWLTLSIGDYDPLTPLEEDVLTLDEHSALIRILHGMDAILGDLPATQAGSDWKVKPNELHNRLAKLEARPAAELSPEQVTEIARRVADELRGDAGMVQAIGDMVAARMKE